MRFLLDTNVVSEAMRRSPSRELLANLARHEGQYGISAVTWLELVYGVNRTPAGRRRLALEAGLRELRQDLPPPLPFTVEAAEWLGAERARLAASGRTIATEDGQIAAIAHEAHLVLVTANTKDFAHYDELDVVDWSRRAKRVR